MKKIIISLVFISCFDFGFSQIQLTVKRDCDTSFMQQGKQEPIITEKTYCTNSPKGAFLFKNEQEYKVFYKKHQSGHPNCGDSGINIFDFNKYDILYYGENFHGCSDPDINIRTYHVNGELIIYTKIKIKGPCVMLNHFSTYFLLDKNKFTMSPIVIECYK